MEINLRKANAIQAEIRRAINSSDVQNTISVNEYTPNVADTINVAVDKYQAEVARKVALTKALYNIRKSVGQANATAGINDVLADVQAIDAEVAIYNDVAKQPVAKSIEEINARIEKQKNAPNDTRTAIYGDRYNNIESSVVPVGSIDAAKIRIKELKRQRQNLQDKLLGLNINTMITVGNVDENVLKLEGIL